MENKKEDKFITVVIVMKNGKELKVKCKEFEVQTNKLYGTLEGYKIKGIKENCPLYVNMRDIQFIYRV